MLPLIQKLVGVANSNVLLAYGGNRSLAPNDTIAHFERWLHAILVICTCARQSSDYVSPLA